MNIVELPAITSARSLPDGWRIASLGVLAHGIQNGMVYNHGHDHEGYPVTRIETLSDDRINPDKVGFVRNVSDMQLSRYLLSPGDILFSHINSVQRLGRAVIYEGLPDNLLHGMNLLRIQVDNMQCDSSYVCRYLNLLQLQGYFVSIANKAINQASINQRQLSEIKVPLPPLREQQRIAAILTEQMAAVERARAAAEAQLEAAKALPAAYLRAVFESDEAREWPRVRLGSVLRLRKDVVYPRDKPEGPATFVGLEHIQSGTGLRSGSLPLEMSDLTGRKPRFLAGDIVYGYLRPYLNKVWIAEFDGLCSVDQYVYSVEPAADARFIAWFMRSPLYLTRAPIQTTPGQLPRIRTEEVAAVELGLPPLDQQQRIADAIERTMHGVRQMEAGIKSQSAAAEQLPAALLRRAFSGDA